MANLWIWICKRCLSSALPQIGNATFFLRKSQSAGLRSHVSRQGLVHPLEAVWMSTDPFFSNKQPSFSAIKRRSPTHRRFFVATSLIIAWSTQLITVNFQNDQQVVDYPFFLVYIRERIIFLLSSYNMSTQENRKLPKDFIWGFATGAFLILRRGV